MSDYEAGMIESAITAPAASLDAALREDLAQGDEMIRSVIPILRHLLASDQHSLFADEVVARVRGGIYDLARQLLDALAAARGETERGGHDSESLTAFADALSEVPGLIAHLHALAVESQLSERLHDRLALDPVLPPLVQALLASTDAATSALAMNLLAAQVRFQQSQRRMQALVSELPADLMHAALVVMRGMADADSESEAAARSAESSIRDSYDESRTRLGIISRLVTGMGGGAVAALSLTHAGVAIFTTALALCSSQDRDVIVLSTNEGQIARLALSLRAAGLKPSQVGEQIIALHPEVTLPDGFDGLGADRAAALLAVSGPLLEA
jgi:hypothetical protein